MAYDMSVHDLAAGGVWRANKADAGWAGAAAGEEADPFVEAVAGFSGGWGLSGLGRRGRGNVPHLIYIRRYEEQNNLQ